ncbi:LADA_0C05776g1_1 [Lachancea dasiensis]|uniref:tRNA dimethylallyltransferase n=1 Tax=Lachancea dasiensis TaxID=1072105 RepID=A0A1G4IZ08_9SACH|nr:LADA_0C05776g1_1 [Lachancea dasiensis]
MLRWLTQKLNPMPKPKVIVIAGTTGVGKSQLSIQIASHVSGEVINSDSMQVYKGVPIITNKHPVLERNNVSHHVMNHVNWDEEYYLHRFEKECLSAIEEIHSRGKIPVIVGGTHYYLQILLSKRVDQKTRVPTTDEQAILDSNDSDAVYGVLQKIDPSIAAKYHPNDTRRVRRMLEIYYTTGQRPSETFAGQKNTLKFDTLFYWIYSKPETLEPRLDSRVDQMMDAGALSELEQLFEFYKNHIYTQDDCEHGVWQVIGFKEFLAWLEKTPGASFDLSVDRMKLRTRQYAKKQVKWIKKMLLPDVKDHLFVLDATDLQKWDQNVAARAMAIVDKFIVSQPIAEEHAPPTLSGLLIDDLSGTSSPKAEKDWNQYVCHTCRDKEDKPLLAIGDKNWQVHLKSRRHRTNSTRAKRQKQHQQWKENKLESSSFG